jgi:hypothetical protein
MYWDYVIQLASTIITIVVGLNLFLLLLIDYIEQQEDYKK